MFFYLSCIDGLTDLKEKMKGDSTAAKRIHVNINPKLMLI